MLRVKPTSKARAVISVDDPTETFAAKFAVMHNVAFPTITGCIPRIESST